MTHRTTWIGRTFARRIEARKIISVAKVRNGHARHTTAVEARTAIFAAKHVQRTHSSQNGRVRRSGLRLQRCQHRRRRSADRLRVVIEEGI